MLFGFTSCNTGVNMAGMPALKAVGYWRNATRRRLPRPQWLVRPEWRADDRDGILAYLRSGFVVAKWFGYAPCRFDCGVSPLVMGDSDLTDGVWVWPQGLAHYIEAHEVSLPDEFIADMASNGWVGSPLELDKRLTLAPDDSQFDYAFWIAWASRRRPWYQFW